MRVKSIYLEDVRGLPIIALDFTDPVTRQIRPRTVIAGSNGTGKTTILEAIFALMKLMVAQPTEPLETWLTPNQVRVKLELRDMPALSHPNPQYEFSAGWPLAVALGPKVWLSRAQIEARYNISVTGNSRYNWRYVHHDEPGPFTSLTWRIQREWMEAERPSALYFPSERRELVAKEQGQIIAEGKEHEWAWRFSDSERWQGSLESFIVALYARERFEQIETLQDEREAYPTFQEFLEVVNGFLTRKRITGVSPTTFRVQVVSEESQKFSLDELSSGEKQILLILAEIQRRISKGSIVLIDEPEIHLHPQWQRLLVRALTDLCAEYDAQLIITTHSEQIANAVYEHELILLDDIFERAPVA